MGTDNFNDTTPAAPAGNTNVKWQSSGSSPRRISAYEPVMVGDSGLGGTSGAVPAPASGDAAAGKFLKADGTWETPGGSGTVTTTGTPASGELAKFSGATSITNGDLSGDVTTSGTLATTLANSGVTAGSYTSANITVDAKGRVTAASNGSSGLNFADGEVPSGSINGSNTSFTLAHSPNPALSLILNSDGTILEPGGVGFTLTSASLALVSAPVSVLRAWYRY